MKPRGSGWRMIPLLAIVAAFPGKAHSLAPDAMSSCAALADNAARLSCYDNMAREGPGDAPADGGGGLLDSRWELRRESRRGVFGLRPYKPVYLAPASWTTGRNTTPNTPNPETTVTEPFDLDTLEAKFQLSLKFKIAQSVFGSDADLWGGYTQVSRWQVYNGENSRPFRETNYEPEMMLVMPTDYRILGWRGRLAGIGLNHQSNGRGDPLSRSWNRVMLLVGLEREGWALMVRPWRRIDDGNEDDNPDIPDYMGRFDITAVHIRGEHQFSLTARHSLKGGERSHGALQLEWAFPIRGPLRGRASLFHGYGESMIDYNFKATWVSLGFSLVEWF